MVPPKVYLFLWKLHHAILPVNAFLFNRYQPNFYTDQCSWFKREPETLFHLFMECELAK